MKQPVIDPNAGKSDPNVGDYSRLLRSPETRVVGLTWENWIGDGPFMLNFSNTNRAYFCHVRRGAAFLRTGQGENELHYAPAGTSIGIEGRSHQWMDRSHIPPNELTQFGAKVLAVQDFPVEIVLSSIDRSVAVLQRLKDGTIIIPDSARPYSETIRGCIDLVGRSIDRKHPNLGVLRRLSEIIMLELVAFARSQMLPVQTLANDELHDEYLLRALSAFFATPNAKWTVEELAEVAGISRTAFAERFQRAFGAPPLRMINQIRLRIAAEMLLTSKAPLREIAEEIGFGSSAAFVRAFGKQYHLTPTAWRCLATSERAAVLSRAGV